MNAVKLYVSTAKLILENDQHDYTLCKAINNSFANLELSLSCGVCRCLLNEPYSPTETTCQHHVCKSCLGGPKKLKPSCSWCKDYTKYVRNTQLQCLLACYKGLCQYVKCANLLVQLTDACSLADQEKRVLAIVNRGAQLAASGGDAKPKVDASCPSSTAKRLDGERNHRYRRYANASSGVRLNHDSSANSSDESCVMDVSRTKVERRTPDFRSSLGGCEKLPRIDPSKTETHTLRLRRIPNNGHANTDDSAASDVDSQQPPLYSVAFANSRSKLILKRRTVQTRPSPPSRRETKYANEVAHSLPIAYSLRTPDYAQNHLASSFDRGSRFRKTERKSKYANRPTCRCGNATPRPGKLTCCGQRCPCYMQSKSCSSCRCRGCRNPHLIDGVKILRKFLNDDDHNETKIVSVDSTTSQATAGSINCVNDALNDLPNTTTVMSIS